VDGKLWPYLLVPFFHHDGQAFGAAANPDTTDKTIVFAYYHNGEMITRPGSLVELLPNQWFQLTQVVKVAGSYMSGQRSPGTVVGSIFFGSNGPSIWDSSSSRCSLQSQYWLWCIMLLLMPCLKH
jgi:hypothetical protein